ncbi:MAG: ABC transporter substrate-binding protein [Methylococcales bacterium]
MNLKSLKLVLVFMISILATSAVYAQDDEVATAKQVVEKFQSELIAVMKDGKKLGYAGRYQKLSDPISNSHDLTKIARIVVGKEWEKLSEDQQQKLTDIFIRLSIASYAHNFKDYSGESFGFDSEEETTRGGVVVHTHLVIPNDKPVKFDYMLKEKGSSWRIINIIANGVSDLALKRSEYTTILQREGFDVLMSKINEKIDSYSKL